MRTSYHRPVNAGVDSPATSVALENVERIMATARW
jgi:hypothetical protein